MNINNKEIINYIYYLYMNIFLFIILYMKNKKEKVVINRLRIISGKYRNHYIERPSWETTRPTIEKIREAIFSSIHFNLENAVVLDLFTGSGAWIIEAISRGAKHAVGLEKDKNAYQIINSNLNKLKIDNATVVLTDCYEYLLKNDKAFDFIFMDAPFKDYELINKCLELIDQKNLLNKNGNVIIETNNRDKIVIPKDMIVIKEKLYSFNKSILFISKDIE